MLPDIAPNVVAPAYEAIGRTSIMLAFDSQSRRFLAANHLCSALFEREVGADETAEQILCLGASDLAELWAAALAGSPAAFRCGLRLDENRVELVTGDLVLCPNGEANDQVVLVARIDQANELELLDLRGRAKAVDRSQAIIALRSRRPDPGCKPELPAVDVLHARADQRQAPSCILSPDLVHLARLRRLLEQVTQRCFRRGRVQTLDVRRQGSLDPRQLQPDP